MWQFVSCMSESRWESAQNYIKILKFLTDDFRFEGGPKKLLVLKSHNCTPYVNLVRCLFF